LNPDHGHSHVSRAQGSAPVIEVDIRNAHDASEYAGLEEYLRGLPGITFVHLDRTRGVAHLSYDPAVTTPGALERHLNGCGYRCECYGRPGSVAQTGHPRVGLKEHAEHVPAVKPEEHAAMGHGEHAGQRANRRQRLVGLSPPRQGIEGFRTNR
jgi:P-type Cu2+ transporter